MSDSTPASSSSRSPSSEGLKGRVISAIWEVVDQLEIVRSATLTGSFVVGDGLQGISDIDLVVIVDRLNRERFNVLTHHFDAALRPVVADQGFQLRINPTLGPLKYNDAATAVLHLMIYDVNAHVDHVINSPFTCFDWQRSEVFRKRNLVSIYPVFGLQPRHFVSARRSISDYLRDYRARVVSYRELDFDHDDYRQQRREKVMTNRDRHEFAYHIVRFLMQNLLKLVHRRNAAPDGMDLVDAYLHLFPRSGDDLHRFYAELTAHKCAQEFSTEIVRLDSRLERFVSDFERQFRLKFHEQATRHILFRHAKTPLNQNGAEQRFLGRLDPTPEPVAPQAYEPLLATLVNCDIQSTYQSPLRRCRESLAMLAATSDTGIPTPTTDDRLIEMDYGACDGLTVAEVRQTYPALFAAWDCGEDPAFPKGGESTTDVAARVNAFARDRWQQATGNSLSCTHNVVLRCLLGAALGVPRTWWYRLRIPHLQPIEFVQTRDWGRFANLQEPVERQLFADFVAASDEATTGG